MQKIIKYKVSDDAEFVREIELKDDSSFKDLHTAIQKACKYDPSLITMFYMRLALLLVRSRSSSVRSIRGNLPSGT